MRADGYEALMRHLELRSGLDLLMVEGEEEEVPRRQARKRRQRNKDEEDDDEEEEEDEQEDDDEEEQEEGRRGIVRGGGRASSAAGRGGAAKRKGAGGGGAKRGKKKKKLSAAERRRLARTWHQPPWLNGLELDVQVAGQRGERGAWCLCVCRGRGGGGGGGAVQQCTKCSVGMVGWQRPEGLCRCALAGRGADHRHGGALGALLAERKVGLCMRG